MISDASKVYESLEEKYFRGVIYLLVDPRTERVRYIGQTTKSPDNRMFEHLRDARQKSKTKNKKQEWLCDLMDHSMLPMVKVAYIALTDNELNFMEAVWFHYFENNGHNPLNEQRFNSANHKDLIEYVRDNFIDETNMLKVGEMARGWYTGLMKEAYEKNDEAMIDFRFD